MLRKSAPPEKKPARLSPEEMRAGIERLQKRVEDLRNFDPQGITEQYNGPQLQKLNASVDEALVRTFGSDTLDYERYKDAAYIDNGPHNYAFPVPIEKVQDTIRRGRVGLSR